LPQRPWWLLKNFPANIYHKLPYCHRLFGFCFPFKKFSCDLISNVNLWLNLHHKLHTPLPIVKLARQVDHQAPNLPQLPPGGSSGTALACVEAKPPSCREGLAHKVPIAAVTGWILCRMKCISYCLSSKLWSHNLPQSQNMPFNASFNLVLVSKLKTQGFFLYKFYKIIHFCLLSQNSSHGSAWLHKFIVL
jgi:hypothetical protein